jgi:hypothetical protein
LSVNCVSHAREKQFLGPLGQVVHNDLLVHGNRLDDFVDRLALDFCADHVDLLGTKIGSLNVARSLSRPIKPAYLRSIRVGDFQESHPVAVARLAAAGEGDLVVEAEAVSDLQDKSRTISSYANGSRRQSAVPTR